MDTASGSTKRDLVVPSQLHERELREVRPLPMEFCVDGVDVRVSQMKAARPRTRRRCRPRARTSATAALVRLIAGDDGVAGSGSRPVSRRRH